MSWKEFAHQAPELASLGFERFNRRIVYLATIKKDGSPRLHPVTPSIGEGRLFMFTEPSSPKIRDLRRDPRYAMHCAVGGGAPLFEYLISGSAELITDPELREKMAAIMNAPVVDESYALFEFQVERVLVVDYDQDKNRLISRWSRAVSDAD